MEAAFLPDELTYLESTNRREVEEDGNNTRVCKGEKKRKIAGKMRPLRPRYTRGF